jgi:5,5'-dehydrodivanillate O-demethylase
MPLTREENDLLVRVGPGTPGGELLRRYWQPIAPISELTAEQPTKFVRVMGENLVLFRDTTGRVGLIADKCSHRNASMLYGRVEERGISCAYHGWLYDTNGCILETPPEKNDAILSHVKQKAYPVRQFVGLYWTYMGPDPVPQLPRYDTLVRRDGERRIVMHPVLDCNWFQAMENSADPAHLQILHQEYIGRGRQPVNTTRGFTDDVADFDFYVNEVGLMKKRTYKNGQVDEHPLVFPNILRQGPSTQYRVPIDDEHTMHIHVVFEPNDGSVLLPEDHVPSVEYVKPYKDPPEGLHPYAHFDMRSVIGQDHMAWETQGAIADRSQEHLSYSDRGVVMYRRLMREQIERVQQGLDPINVIRDENHPVVDTNIDESIKVEGGGRPVGIASAVAQYSR